MGSALSVSAKPCSCGAPSVYHARYSGDRLCAEHFAEFVERRVRKELRKQGPFRQDAHIAVALSGGKDSVVTLRLVHAIFRDNPRIRVSAVTVDEGIAGYRPPSVEASRRHCEALGVEHLVLSYAETAGVTMDEVVKHPGRAHAPCAYCGVLRRRNLNEAAKRVGATHLATGHNLDDTAQSILMNHLRGDVDRLGRYRDLLLDLEEKEPGTRHALLAGYDRLAPLLSRDQKLSACTDCGEPTSGDRCRACALLEQVGGRIPVRLRG